MEGTDLVYILLLTVIPVFLALLIALPFIADRPRAQSTQQSAPRSAREDVGAGAPGQPVPSSRPLGPTPPGPARQAA